MLFCIVFFPSSLGLVRVEHADVRQVAILLGKVQAVAYDKGVGYGEADVIGVDGLDAARGLIQQHPPRTQDSMARRISICPPS